MSRGQFFERSEKLFVNDFYRNIFICWFQFTSKVISCEEVSNKSIIINSQKTNFNGFEVVLENTILFPEGGGQVVSFIQTGNFQYKRIYEKRNLCFVNMILSLLHKVLLCAIIFTKSQNKVK